MTFTWGTRWQAWRSDFSLDWLQAKDMNTGAALTRRAKWSSHLKISRDQGDWRTGFAWHGVSSRFDRANNANRMGGYSLFDVFADYRLNKQWTLTSRIDNIFDKRYEPAYGYNSPGVAGYLGVRFVTN